MDWFDCILDDMLVRPISSYNWLDYFLMFVLRNAFIFIVKEMTVPLFSPLENA